MKWKAPKVTKTGGLPDGYILEMRKRNQTNQEEEAERRAAAKAAAKAAKQTWSRKLPDFHEVEIASPKLELEVEVNSNVTDAIHWKKDGKRLKEGDGIEFLSFGNTRKLVIRKTISEEDQGTYTAKVGAKKCECKVSISLFGDNNNNNANENNNNNNNNNNVASIRAAPVNLAREVRPEVKTHETISNNCASIANVEESTTKCGANTGNPAGGAVSTKAEGEDDDEADENEFVNLHCTRTRAVGPNDRMHPD